MVRRTHEIIDPTLQHLTGSLEGEVSPGSHRRSLTQRKVKEDFSEDMAAQLPEKTRGYAAYGGSRDSQDTNSDHGSI